MSAGRSGCGGRADTLCIANNNASICTIRVGLFCAAVAQTRIERLWPVMRSLTAIADLSAKAYSHYWRVAGDICIRFGERLRKLRRSRGWTQVYMAEHIGMDRSF